MLYDGASIFNDTVDLFSGVEPLERKPSLQKPAKIESLLSAAGGISEWDKQHLFTYLLEGGQQESRSSTDSSLSDTSKSTYSRLAVKIWDHFFKHGYLPAQRNSHPAKQQQSQS